MASTSASCAKCAEPLVLDLSNYDSEDEDHDTQMGEEDQEDESIETVPDDVHLKCGDHFHWECLLDSYELSKCPVCSQDITSAPPSSSSGSSPELQILVDLNNEGGLQRQIDIYPILREESYLRAYPEERKCRAFLELCGEGDHRAIVDLLKSCSESAADKDDDMEEESSEPSKSADEVLRYQDPIGGMQSGLHVAVANGHREVAWLLLLLASDYPELEFPALVYQEAASLGVMREDQSGKVDIRSLRDAQDRTAEDIARYAGVIWHGWTGNSRLTMP